MTRFQAADRLIKWAFEGLHEAHAAFFKFMKTKPLASAVEYDAETGEQVLYYRQIADFPSDIMKHLTSTLNHARHSFDQSIFAACAEIGNPIKDGHYPWATSPSDLEGKLKRLSKDRFIDERLWDEIRRHEPYFTGEGYPGGNDLIREISILANSKHTTGFDVAGRVNSVSHSISYIEAGGELTPMAPVWDFEKKQIELVRSKGDVSYDYPTMTFCISFAYAGRLRGIDAINALHSFVTKAQSVNEGLKAECFKINNH